jgi:putative transposase
LWQGRFQSCPLDERYLYCAVRYVERNPVRAGLAAKAEDYQWSSAREHITGERGGLLDHFYLLDEIKNWREYLDSPDTPEEVATIRKHSRTGRPTGSINFLKRLEVLTQRVLIKQKPGPKSK